jgi:hypothetical protein
VWILVTGIALSQIPVRLLRSHVAEGRGARLELELLTPLVFVTVLTCSLLYSINIIQYEYTHVGNLQTARGNTAVPASNYEL